MDIRLNPTQPSRLDEAALGLISMFVSTAGDSAGILKSADQILMLNNLCLQSAKKTDVTERTWGTLVPSLSPSLSPSAGMANTSSSLMVVFNRLQLDDLGSEESKACKTSSQRSSATAPAATSQFKCPCVRHQR